MAESDWDGWGMLSAALGGASGTIVNIVPPQVRATATAAFLLGATMLALVAGMAALLPARRAASIDPCRALRGRGRISAF